MNRQEFTAKTKAQAFARANGCCEGDNCGARLTPGKFRYDHRVPCQMGGDNSLENCTVLCLACDLGQKTPQDLRDIAKAKRIERKHLGIRKRSTFACSRDSRWRKKINGQVVPR